MKTGDIVLYKQSKTFTRWWLIDKIITTFTGSSWVHVGFVIKDPKWLGIKGTYLMESAWTGIGDVTDGRKHFGVQLVPLAERIIPGSTYYREYIGDDICHTKLEKIFNELKDKPYDINPIDWVEAYIGYDPSPQRENSFWCSSLVACILTKLEILDEDTDWTLVVPEFFSNKKLPHYTCIDGYRSDYEKVSRQGTSVREEVTHV
jgi:hypothetical protein